MFRGIERTAGKPLHTDVKTEPQRHDNLYAAHVSSHARPLHVLVGKNVEAETET